MITCRVISDIKCLLHSPDLYCAQDYSGIDMLELGHHSLTDVLAFLLIYRLIPRQGREYRNTAPLRTLVECNEELGKSRLIDDE